MPTTDNDVFQELKQIMTDAILKMSLLADTSVTQSPHFLDMAKVFLIGIMSTAADIAETTSEGAAPWLYAEIEAAAKQGGIENIRNTTATKNQYSISGIAPNDDVNAMNYIGQQLATTLFKSIHELPSSLRKPEMLLRGVEALLGNLLDQKFSDCSHDVLDSLCEHVHMSLHDLQSQSNPKGTQPDLHIV